MGLTYSTGLTSSLPWKQRRCAIVSVLELGGQRESSCFQASRVSGEASGDAATERTHCPRESGEKTQRVPTTCADFLCTQKVSNIKT